MDRNGKIYRLMSETMMARHVIGLNLHSIGIENVGGTDDKNDLTEAQLLANAKLVHFLKSRHPQIEYLIGHHEALRFKKHPLWKENDPNYRTIKSDPGPDYMSRLRALVMDVGLKGPP